MATDERKAAGANYIINFFNEMQQLKVYYSQYINFLLEIKTKYGSSPESKNWSDEEKQALSNLAQTVRHLCNLTYISFVSIFSSGHMNTEKTIMDRAEKLYFKIINTYVIESRELEEFVLLLNKAMINDVIQNMLMSSQDIVSNIYNDNAGKNT